MRETESALADEEVAAIASARLRHEAVADGERRDGTRMIVGIAPNPKTTRSALLLQSQTMTISWPVDQARPGAGGDKKKKRRTSTTDTTSLSLPALPPAPWLTQRQRQPHWSQREDVRTNAQYAGGALIGAWLLRRVATALSPGGGGRRPPRGAKRRQPQPGLFTTLLGSLAGIACVYRARGGDLNAKARELKEAAAQRLREAELAVQNQAREAERRVRAALREAEREVVPALRKEAEQGRRELERSFAQVERAMQEAADVVEAEVAAASSRRTRAAAVERGRGGGGD